MLCFSSPLPLSFPSTPWRSPRCQAPIKSSTTPPDPQPSSNPETTSTSAHAIQAAAATFILTRSANAYLNRNSTPPSDTVSSSILQLERLQKRHKVTTHLSKLYATWQLVFIANPRSRNPFARALYFPLSTRQRFFRPPASSALTDTDGDGIFENGIYFFGGYATFKIWGPFRWVAGGRNRMEFIVDSMSIGLGTWEWSWDGLDKGGGTLKGRTAKELPFFTFFALRDDIAVARGRSGGLALYARVGDEGDP